MSWFARAKVGSDIGSSSGSDGGKPYKLDDALREHFAPVLRRHGFKGSGRHFRRVSGEVFEAVNVQSSTSGSRFAVNLGMHPLAVPDYRDNLLDVKKAIELNCAFRRRLAEGQGDRWWDYADTEASMIEAVRDAAGLFETRGLELFNAESGPGAPLFTTTPESFERAGGVDVFGRSLGVPNLALLLARLRKAQGKFAECRAFALIGLREAEPRFHYRLDLEQLAKEGQ